MKKRILNVGCGEDTYGTHFFDLFPSRSEVLRCDVNDERFPFPDNSFDEVYAECLFEHLKNPMNFLVESYRVLKRGGKIIVITDNAGLWGFLGNVHHGEYEKIRANERVLGDKHYALFTPSHLKNWLESAKFREIEVNYFFDSKKVMKIHLLLLKFLMNLNRRFAPHIKAVAKK